MIGIAALMFASLFTGAAFYINVAEHPARMVLPPDQARAQWVPAYKRGYAMQATLAVLAGVCGVLLWWRWGSALHLAGGILMLLNWPWTLFAIMPVNRRLLAGDGDVAAMLTRWNRLHAVRTILGAAGMACFSLALLKMR